MSKKCRNHRPAMPSTRQVVCHGKPRLTDVGRRSPAKTMSRNGFDSLRPLQISKAKPLNNLGFQGLSRFWGLGSVEKVSNGLSSPGNRAYQGRSAFIKRSGPSPVLGKNERSLGQDCTKAGKGRSIPPNSPTASFTVPSKTSRASASIPWVNGNRMAHSPQDCTQCTPHPQSERSMSESS